MIRFVNKLVALQDNVNCVICILYESELKLGSTLICEKPIQYKPE